MISVIIPTYNEEGVIGNTVRYLTSLSDWEKMEILVVDGGSVDGTVPEAEAEGALVISTGRKGRSVQMNDGAKKAKGSILYFLHADSTPPRSLAADIRDALTRGFSAGCYRLRFDHPHWFLRMNSWFTRFDIDAFRFGDQSLFVTRQLFDSVGGFCEKHLVMEDQEIIKRLRRGGKFVILPKEITTSARKYVAHGIYRMQAIFFLTYFKYQLGWRQDTLLATLKAFTGVEKRPP